MVQSAWWNFDTWPMLPSTSSHFDSNHLKQVAPVKRLFLQFLVRNVSLQKHLFKGFYLSTQYVPQHYNDCTTSQLLFEVWRARQNRSANVHVSAKSFLNILIVSWDVTKFRRPFFQPKAYVKTENTVFQSIRCGA